MVIAWPFIADVVELAIVAKLLDERKIAGELVAVVLAVTFLIVLLFAPMNKIPVLKLLMLQFFTVVLNEVDWMPTEALLPVIEKPLQSIVTLAAATSKQYEPVILIDSLNV